MGMTTCLSPTIQNKLIEILRKNVEHLILEEVKDAKYFFYFSTQAQRSSLSHTHRLAFVVRYVQVDSSEVKKSFLDFYSLYRKKT